MIPQTLPKNKEKEYNKKERRFLWERYGQDFLNPSLEVDGI